MKRRLIVAVLTSFILAALFSQSSTKVYVTATGKKYHTQFCRTIKNSKTTEMTKQGAQKTGYDPCKICKP